MFTKEIATETNFEQFCMREQTKQLPLFSTLILSAVFFLSYFLFSFIFCLYFFLIYVVSS